jgi:hypothetical protein
MMLPIATRIHRFQVPGLDPITVYVEEYAPGRSMITVQCYSQAWTTFWGSHGDGPVEDFITHVHADYVVMNLKQGQNGLMVKKQERYQIQYLMRIVKAMQDHFRKASEVQS